MMRPTRTVAAILLTVLLVAASPTAATALPVSAPLAAPAAPDFNPSPNKFRAWMVNILSSVLGGATPSKVRAEQLANTFKYDHSWEQFSAVHDYAMIDWEASQSAGEPRWKPRSGSGTLTDAQLAKIEQSYKMKSATGSGPVRAPATPFKSLLKVAGGGLTAFAAYEISAALTANIGVNPAFAAFGIDSNGMVCTAPTTTGWDVEEFVLETLSGQDCSEWDLAEQYIANMDLPKDWTLGDRRVGLVTYTGATSNLVVCATGSSLHNTGQSIAVEATGEYTTAPTTRPMSTTGTVRFESPVCTGGMGTRAGELTSCYLINPATPSTICTGITITRTYLYNTTTGAVITEGTAAVADPDRQQECTVTYTDGSSLSALGATYKESSGAIAPPVCPKTPDGKTPDSVTVDENQAGGPSTEVYSEGVNDEYKDWWETYPECRTGACKLDLIRVLPSPAVSCFELEDGCVDWFTDPDKTENYLCRYGERDVPLAECNVYSGLFQPGRVTTGAPYSDPSTGEWSGGQNSPREADSAMSRTIQDPEELRSCRFPNAFLDPVGAAVAGGQCLMEWTFVPRPTVVEVAFAGATEAWEGKPPAEIAESVAAANLAPSASGCSISVTILGGSGKVIDACSGPMAMLPILTRIITAGFLAIGVFILVRRQVAAMVNYNQGQG